MCLPGHGQQQAEVRSYAPSVLHPRKLRSSRTSPSGWVWMGKSSGSVWAGDRGEKVQGRRWQGPQCSGVRRTAVGDSEPLSENT